jgi:hypothetical protein
MPTSARAVLVWYSPFDGSAAAEVGQFDGAVFGAVPTADRDGTAGGALFFDGSNDVVTVDQAEYPSFAAGTYTAWVRPDTIDNYRGFVSVGRSAGGQTEYFEGIFESGGLRFDVDDGDDGIGRKAIRVNSGNPGTWRHVALSFTAEATMQAYVDGALVGSASLAGGEPTIDPTFDWVIGELRGSPGSPVDPFHGAIDDISVWSHALSGSEVAALADATETPVSIDTTLRVDFGLAGQDVEPLFHEMSTPTAVPSLDAQFTSGLGVAGEVTVELAAGVGNLGARIRSPDLNEPLGDLVEDQIKNDSGEVLELTLTDLRAGSYRLDAYLNDNEFGSLGQVDIEVDDARGDGRLMIGGFPMGGPGTSNLAVATIDFLANGLDPVTVRFTEIPGTRPGGGNQEISLNGFSLVSVPEPSAFCLALLCCMGLAFAGRGRRR